MSNTRNLIPSFPKTTNGLCAVPSRNLNLKGTTVKISAAFPSNYVKASDLNRKTCPLTIRTCVSEELGQGNDKESKPVLYFQDRQKGLVLNKTNANVIAEAYGDDTGNWTGKTLEIYPTVVDFKGKLVDGIRVRIQPEAQPEAQPQVQPAAAPMADEFGDEVPGF